MAVNPTSLLDCPQHRRADVEFRRIPAVFNQRWGHDAAVYYTLEAMGLVEKIHRPLFDAIHRDRLDTTNEQVFSAWLQKQGVDPKKFMETMKSFGVQSKTRRAVQQTTAYKIDGTPAMAVPWPPRYLVAEWTMMSAPHSKGRMR